MKRTFVCECINSGFVAGETISLEFIWPGPAPKAGQFFLIKPKRTGMFLGRPISFAGWIPSGQGSGKSSAKGGPAKKGTTTEGDITTDSGITTNSGILRFLIVRRGQGTRELTDLRSGEEAELTGPLGNYWTGAEILKDISKNKSGGAVALVGGGIGIAPLLPFARELEVYPESPIPYDFYAGFRSHSFGINTIAAGINTISARSLTITSEDGSEGLKGRIPDFFTPSGYRAVFTCGPEPMIKAIGDACIASEVPCFISVERHMACGVGACLGCTVKTIGQGEGGYKHCCTDGPIFRAEELCFEKH